MIQFPSMMRLSVGTARPGFTFFNLQADTREPDILQSFEGFTHRNVIKTSIRVEHDDRVFAGFVKFNKLRLKTAGVDRLFVDEKLSVESQGDLNRVEVF